MVVGLVVFEEERESEKEEEEGEGKSVDGFVVIRGS